MKVFALEGNRQKLDGGAMFGNAPRAMWEKWGHPDELGRIELACRALLVALDEGLALFETGIGAYMEPKLADRYGVMEPSRHVLLDNLKQLGYSETDVKWVVLSHLHFDHAGGLLSVYDPDPKKQRLLFPNAQYVISDEALKRCERPHPRDRASFIPGLLDKLRASGRLLVIKDQKNFNLGNLSIELIETYGHTPGHMHSLIRVGKQPVFFCGDLIPGRFWLHEPITMGYDRFPELLVDEKHRVYERAIAEGWWMFFTHDAEFSGCFIQKGDKGKIEAKDLNPTRTGLLHFA